MLCFKLQESRIAVVSSTAAATLRQLVMVVMDKMVDEDRRNAESDDDQSTPTERTSSIMNLSQIQVTLTLPDGSTARLGPSAKDAYSVFEDLCLLANSEKPNFLKLEFLHKTFALELIESVLTNYHVLFRKVCSQYSSSPMQIMRHTHLVHSAHIPNPPPSKPPLSSPTQSPLGSTFIPTNSPMHTRSLPSPQTVFIRAEDGDRGVFDAPYQNYYG